MGRADNHATMILLSRFRRKIEANGPLAWPVAALLILGLSAALWLGIFYLAWRLL